MSRKAEAKASAKLALAKEQPQEGVIQLPILPARLTVNKSYKLFIGGAFVRSESGRFLQVKSDGDLGSDPPVVNLPWGSRKDLRDAVLAAKSAGSKWAGKTAYNRGQILYRLAEMTEARADELQTALVRAGLSAEQARRELGEAVDRIVYYAGMADKLSALLASHNPVAGPHFGFTVPEPSGVIGVLAPPAPALLGLLSAVLPVITAGNSCVVVVPADDPAACDGRVALQFAECLATCDLPGGVVNLVTGVPSELLPVLARHREVAGLLVFSEDDALCTEVAALAAGSVQRTHFVRRELVQQVELRGQGLGWIEPFLEYKSIWHPSGI